VIASGYALGMVIPEAAGWPAWRLRQPVMVAGGPAGTPTVIVNAFEAALACARHTHREGECARRRRESR